MLALRAIVTPGIARKDIEEKAREVKISKKHFERAIRRVKPTTSKESLKIYDQSTELFAKYSTDLEEEDFEAGEQEKEIEHKNTLSLLQAD